MMLGENVEIVRRFNDAVTRGDREAVATLIHPEVDWRTMAGPLLGVDAVRGRDEVLSFIFDVIPEGVEDFGLRRSASRSWRTIKCSFAVTTRGEEQPAGWKSRSQVRRSIASRRE